ncbi:MULTISPECIES: type II secretion system protein GspL [Enterobacter cloacae complex]|jgi:general secretion pathway protein L|uniref:Type II secretion system protein L n=2 Tax=Enterobacter kobei TaxID=208224 RepID=A0AAW3XL47_9ENTR|nr:MULTISPECIES: type II secretion system protein GspL [Enterobacter cloacae complex]ELN2574544.1 type II secretion system protein GspL [Enterobacter kobei]ESN28498.1 type II secretion system protein L [Enterobacter sp. MGH 22]KDF42873.1 type II secretion system protein L [Enterobacter kobei]KJM95639.1 general secretion pathway protein GspL [Enterobacter kobei]MBC6324652.1 type II secretion system protein GspL [Enterobacter kobei]
MKQVLFVRPDSFEGGKIMWCVSGTQQVETVASLEALADHPLATRVCLLLPASSMIFRHFTLPKKVASLATAFSWMAEETLIGDVDTLHWTVLSKKGAEVDAVAIDADSLQAWLTRCQEAGLTVVQALPDAWLLPVTAGGSTLVAEGETWWLRLSPHVAGEMEANLLPLLMQKAGEGEVCCYGDAPAGVDVDVVLPWQHPLVLIQPQWQACRVTLLHGAFSAKASNGKAARRLNVAMAAVGLLSLSLLLGPRIAMAWMLVQQENQIQQEIQQVYEHHFPSMRHKTNIKYHFGQNMKKQGKGIFLQFDDLEKARQAVPAMEIDLLEYDARQNTLTLSVSAQNQTALQTFVNQASEKFDFTLQPVSTSAPYTAMIAGKYK